MPVHRSTHRATTTPSRTTEILVVELQVCIHQLMDQKSKDLTGDRRERMRWSAKGCAWNIIIRGGKILKGCPTYAGVRFGNLSDVPGGQPVMELLLSLWTSGMLRFEDASEDDVDLAVSNPTAILPGAPLTTPQPTAAETIEGAEDPEDPIEDAVWSSEAEGETSEIDEITD
ncbi:hypothetical protein GSI_03474 [Ganoderma sinense ZZ0214-1]|uniref:Uncharacterized protein n=1 Tax=Ganoderma sinense ZZ0214-1 TaxID=1077348 RepID=A0A2G8SLQ1_9APHY|nr:hypothetical protein GSI_03474 [Ganoderma sinense ZZ0214-1]